MPQEQLGAPSRQCAPAHSFGLQNHDGHPPPLYSPDLALWDFLLFPRMKLKLKVGIFDTAEEIQAEQK
jgi:hypothetical protein